MIKEIGLALDAVRKQKPLVYHLTNYVTANDSANFCLALGGSPIISDAIEEVDEIVSASSSLVINVGTLNSKTIESMIKAGILANQFGIPVILDPVGVGISNFRNQAVLKLLANIRFSVIKGNFSEILFLTDHQATTRGVDSSDNLKRNFEAIVKSCALKYQSIVVATGKTDIVSDGNKTITIENGHPMLTAVTGTGCTTATLIATYSGANSDLLVSAVAGILSIGIAGELAFARSGSQGLGSFHLALIDEVGKLNTKTFQELARINEKSN